MKDQEDPYEILQVHSSAEAIVIQAAYRRLARKYHPDHNKSPDATSRMQRINAAYEILNNPDKRAEYDRTRTRNNRETGNRAAGNSSQGASAAQAGAEGDARQGARAGPKSGAESNSRQGERAGAQSWPGGHSSQGAGSRTQAGSGDDLYDWVTQRLANGVRPDLIVDLLVREGWLREQVHSFVWAIYGLPSWTPTSSTAHFLGWHGIYIEWEGRR